MSIKRVVKMGNPQLASPSLLVDNPTVQSTFLDQLIVDMLDTMHEKGGVGIAAPQIGCNQRVIMFGFEDSDRYPDESSVPFTVLINPTFKPLSNELIDGWEGCLSVPGLRGLVARFARIEYAGFDQFGQFITRTAEGFHARVLQHEYDHLDGILYPQRIKDLHYFGYEDELTYRG